MAARRRKKLDYWKIARGTAITVLLAYLGFRLFVPRPTPKPPPAPMKTLVVGQRLPPAMQARFSTVDWPTRVGDRLGLWVSIYWQRLVVIQGGVVQAIYPCSTAVKGAGNKEGSYQTPLGWHEIAERIGDGLPPGAVFIERKANGKVWSPDQTTERDYVLTRIMWLRGLEPGLNAGGAVDSHDRYIYIHGTPAESKIGAPASLGCIRMTNKDVIELFNRAQSATPLLITEW